VRSEGVPEGVGGFAAEPREKGKAKELEAGSWEPGQCRSGKWEVRSEGFPEGVGGFAAEPREMGGKAKELEAGRWELGQCRSGKWEVRSEGVSEVAEEPGS
jgi:hypothetical protein